MNEKLVNSIKNALEEANQRHSEFREEYLRLVAERKAVREDLSISNGKKNRELKRIEKEGYAAQEAKNVAKAEYEKIKSDLESYEKSGYDDKIEKELVSKYFVSETEFDKPTENTGKREVNTAATTISVIALIVALGALINPYVKKDKSSNLSPLPSATSQSSATPGVTADVSTSESESGKDANLTVVQEEIIARVAIEFPMAKEVIQKSGLFLDATDDAQVEARAQAIYDLYFAGPLEQIREKTKNWDEEDKPVYLSMFTPEELANYIRWRNNVLPKVDGKSVYAVDGSTHDKYITFGAQIGNMTSDGNFFDKPFFIPTCLMSIDGSKDQNLALLWNKDYNDITNVMNGDSTLGSEFVLVKLGEDLRDRALFAGKDGMLTFWDLNDENSNPYAITQDALNPFERVTEWYLSKNSRKNAAEVVCLEVCTNYKTGKPEVYSLARIYTAVIDRTENEVIYQMAGVEPSGRTIEEVFYEAQHDKFMMQREALGTSYSYKG